jgi:hypothetical protein
MESPQNINPPDRQKDNDVDLGMLLFQMGRGIKRFFQLIGKGFLLLGEGLLLFVFFLRRNFLWLAIGTGVGLVYGVYLHTKTGSKYYSEATLRTNFNSSRALYNSVEYLNALIQAKNVNRLGEIFGISGADAMTLVSFEVNPVESELIAADLYKQQFLENGRNEKVRLDTFWARTIKYENFKDGLTMYDYPLHIVKVTSTRRDIFPKIQSGLINVVSANEFLVKSKTSGQQIAREEEEVLKSSIQSLDTLRSAYEKHLTLSPVPNPPTTVNITDKNMEVRAPEIDLYNTMLELKDELKKVRNQSIYTQDIIQVYSPFNAEGQKSSVFRQNIFYYSVLGFMLALFILIAIQLYSIIGRLEQDVMARRNGKSPDTN